MRSSPFLPLLLPTLAAAWSTDVHNQIGHLAEQFLHPSTARILSILLAPEPWYNSSIGAAAAWADGFAHTAEGRYSYQWHWIDSHDSPPQKCRVDWPEACGVEKGGCVVSAIANQTAILKGCVEDVKKGGVVGEGKETDCVRALKWVVHYLGDVAQPLHASGKAAGGNMVNVTAGGRVWNLHSVWDGLILHTAAQLPLHTAFPTHTLHPYFQNLTARIQFADDFLEPTSSFVACADPSLGTFCPLSWALESNKWTCEYVYAHEFNGTDLLEDGYVEGARGVVDLQVAKAGLRLGTWLNRVVLDGPGDGDRDRGGEFVNLEL